MNHTIDFEPIGRRTTVSSAETILSAAQHAGIILNATCGGEGICGHCIVRVMAGKVTEPNQVEESHLGQEQVSQGWRLACQVNPLSDAVIHIAPEALATAQRTQTEGLDLPVELAPAVRAVTVTLNAPSNSDLRQDASSLQDYLDISNLHIPNAVLSLLPGILKENNTHMNLFLRGNTVVGLRPAGTAALGLAVDLGTTKLAGYLVDLASGKTLAASGVMNPQIAYGEDVISRISYATKSRKGRRELQRVVVDALNAMAVALCFQTGHATEDIADAVIVGNTAMHHLLLHLPVSQLGTAPYVPAEKEAMDIVAGGLGLKFAPGANLHLLPNVAGFVGADHVAMLLGSGMLDCDGVILGMDIGTNTEISLIAHGRHYACSTASGPAFEGAHIRHGMRAAPGAIEKVLIHDGDIRLQTVDNQPPVGLCGSGILDLVAQMLKAGMINLRGAFNKQGNNPRIRCGENGMEFVLLTADENDGREISFTRKDISEIQLVKGSIRAGFEILLEKAGITEKEIDTVVIAGAFGTYLDVESGIDIGMFPRITKDRFVQVGNAAGTGARMALLSQAKRAQAIQVARHVSYIELTTEPSFPSLFTKSLLFN